MFTVRHIETGKLETVYGINGINFLFWNKEEGHWYYAAMTFYRPYEVTA